jgi:glyoxylase-like metal-dependent hydrolase (beta-lactamase superfamily II)
MREIVPHVTLIEGLRGANVYLLTGDGGLTIVDSGMAGDVERIAAQLRQVGYTMAQLETLVLTHAHGDHVGGAAEVARRSGAEVVAHKDEVPYIEQSSPLPASSVLTRALTWLTNRLLFRLSPCSVHRAVEDGDVLDALGGLRVIHIPGHTPGSIGLHQPERGILFCGDALFNAHPMTGGDGLRLPMRLVTVDDAQARASARRLAALDVEVLCCGHGEPVVGGAAGRIRALLEDENG